MYWSRSSVPKYSTLISTNWPQLRSTAWRHIIPKSYGMSWRSPKLCMSMARHIRGSLQILRHEEHTRWAVVRISTAPSFRRIVDITSRGRSSQFLVSCCSQSDSLSEDEDGDEEDDIEGGFPGNWFSVKIWETRWLNSKTLNFPFGGGNGEEWGFLSIYADFSESWPSTVRRSGLDPSWLGIKWA